MRAPTRLHQEPGSASQPRPFTSVILDNLASDHDYQARVIDVIKENCHVVDHLSVFSMPMSCLPLASVVCIVEHAQMIDYLAIFFDDLDYSGLVVVLTGQVVENCLV